MKIESYIFSLLKNLVDSRVYPIKTPADAPPIYPLIIYNIVSKTNDDTACSDLKNITVQFDLFANSLHAAQELYDNFVEILKKTNFSFESQRQTFLEKISVYQISSDWNIEFKTN